MHRVDLGESFPTHIYLQNLASIQPRTISGYVSNVTIVIYLFVHLRYLQFLKIVRSTAAAAAAENIGFSFHYFSNLFVPLRYLQFLRIVRFTCSPSCVLAFGCCGGATPVGLPFGSSSLIFISADVVSSIGLLYSFTDLSLCTCIISFSFASIVVAFPILAFAGFFTSFSYSYIHFCSLYLDSSAHALPSPSTRWTFHFVPTFVHSDSPFLAIIITKI